MNAFKNDTPHLLRPALTRDGADALKAVPEWRTAGLAARTAEAQRAVDDALKGEQK